MEISVHTESKENPGQKETTLICTFAPNEYFENEKLTAKLLYDKDELLKSVGTEIKWKKNPTIKKTTKTQKNKRSGQTRTITKEEQLRSFFEIFNDYVPDEEKDEEAQDEEPRLDLYALEETLDELSESLPYALEYYLGIVDEDDGDDYDGEDDEDDEEEDDDEDHRHPNKKKSKTNSRKGSEHTNQKAGDKADPKKQECKQQ